MNSMLNGSRLHATHHAVLVALGVVDVVDSAHSSLEHTYHNPRVGIPRCEFKLNLVRANRI